MEPPRSLAARWRRALDGPPLVLPAPLDRASERWAAAPPRVRAALVVLAVLVLATIAGRGAATSPWGPPLHVVVVTRDLPAGHTLGRQDVQVVTWPRHLAPGDAVREVGSAVGRSLTSGLVAGAALTGRHLGSDGVGAALPAGRAAVPLPLPDGVTVAAGQRLDVLAGDTAGGVRVAADAVVLQVQGTTAWLSVARDDAPVLAGAAAAGQVTVAVLPPAG